ncbi:CsbD family protein [Pseudanabaena mucicola]|uniref:CsbD family protein n=1 Tax=Pseudanabaena mucicola FACHB-723 TaxID=2692860 RepID=A0ABR7ZWX4_9CYAN|nr:CsbD family protein [Pseudanabaena mucicola]MBD2188471.1 CsbD family protein [Pseudanabaena mucicola FACHB-723]
MSFLKQVRKFFTVISLVVLLITILNLNTESSLAAITFNPIAKLQYQVATASQDNTAKNIEGKAQEAFGKLTGNRQTESDGKDKQFKAKTLEGMNNSFINPNYKPSDESAPAEELARETTKDVENQIRDTFN